MSEKDAFREKSFLTLEGDERSIDSRIRSALQSPNTNKDDLRRKVMVDRSFVPFIDGNETGVPAEHIVRSKMAVAIGAFQMAILERGVETATAAEADVLDDLSRMSVRMEHLPNDAMYKEKMDLIDKGMDISAFRNGLSVAKLIRDNGQKQTVPHGRITVDFGL